MDANCFNCPNADEGVKCKDMASCRPMRRRHKLAKGKCKTCDAEASDFHPPHDASSHCESGYHAHCSCDACF